ncbi:MAG: hypothetical protein K2N63_03285, partial [Lachnospiraceae bacterium]|nr:hypothetical protein [Lachnospiraceae bacterium]
MKKFKKQLAMMLVILMGLSLIPKNVLAQAAEEAYVVLAEPGLEAQVVNKIYGNVAVVWTYDYSVYQTVYCLLEYTEDGIQRISDNYRRIDGFTESGFAKARDFQGNYGVLDFQGRDIADFIYERMGDPSDDGYI